MSKCGGCQHRHDGNEPADIDVYTTTCKLDKEGKERYFASSIGTRTPVTFRWIQASHRMVDHKPYMELAEGVLPFPVLSHKRGDRQHVKDDEIYQVDFEIWPTDIVVEKGETLIFEITPKNPEGVA